MDDASLVRRKSLQLTPTGSQSNSARGSKTDLSRVGKEEENEEEEEEEQDRRRTLKFEDEAGKDVVSLEENALCQGLKQ